MDYILRLKLMLTNELKEFDIKASKKIKMETNIQIINEILEIYGNVINIKTLIDNQIGICICLDTILEETEKIYSDEFLNNIYWLKNYNSELNNNEEFQNKLDSLNNFKKWLEEKKLKYEIELEEIEKNNKDKITKILSYLKYNQNIFNDDLKFIYDFLYSKKVNSIEILHILEAIKKNNVIVQKEMYNKKYLKYKDKVVELLDIGFEHFPKIEVDENKEKEIEIKANAIINSWLACFLSDQTINFDLENFKFDERIYSLNEYKAFYHMIMNKIQNRILEQKNLILDKDFYFDKEIRMNILTEYNRLLKIYLDSRKFFDEQIIEYELRQEEMKSLNQTDEIKNHLLFVKRSDDTFFEKDLKNIPCEFLEKTFGLLRDYSNDTLPSAYKKQFTDHKKFENFFELKNDQIRIVLSHICENYYAVEGVGVKKDNIDIKLLTTLCSRPGISVDELEEYKKTETEVFKRIESYCNENRRRGNR